MARAYGANASLLAAFEPTYGNTPTGDFGKIPFVSTTLGSEQSLIANDLIGLTQKNRDEMLLDFNTFQDSVFQEHIDIH